MEQVEDDQSPPAGGKRYWTGKVLECDDFGNRIVTIFYDGKTTQGPWAIMSPKSWATHGCGKTGLGFAQQYMKQTDGKWLKVKG